MTPTAERGSLDKIHDEVSFYPHQVEGVRQMSRMGSLLLADEMGLGKSLQALTATAVEFEQGRARKVLIVAPATLKWNWGAEIEQHTTFSYDVLDGTPKKRLEQITRYAMSVTDILIVNYEQVVAHLEELNRIRFDIAIWDEAHYIKSRRAKRTKAALRLQARRDLLLTGSPMLNQVDDLWALLHKIDPSEYPNYFVFTNRYAVFGGYKDKQVVGIKNHRELHERLASVMIRRRKADVLDLPEKQHVRVVLDLHPEQRKLYEQARDELRIDLPDDPDPMEIENVLTKLLRLKQITGTTACIPGHPDHSSKLDRAVEMVEEIIDNGEHVVVFTQFRAVQAAMVARLTERSIGSFELHGDVPMADRVPTVKCWEQAPPSALVAMLQVASVGLNMTAASKCIFLDKLYSPKMNEQAEDRLHRIGADQTRPIQIFELLCRGTIEYRIEQLLKRKREMFGAVVEESDWKRRLVAALAAGEDE